MIHTQRVQEFFDRIVEVPAEVLGKGKEVEQTGPKIEPLECNSYNDLVASWKDTSHEEGGKKGALYLTDQIDVTLSVMLAIVASTKLQGSQIWLRVIGPPGSVKSTLCEAISACEEHVFPMSMLTGIHSGYGASEDCSLVSKINGKTVIVNEGDMLLVAPNMVQILGELRDIYTGVTRAHYRNGKSYVYKGLRITFILAGTPSLRKLNRSSLGDRFLDCVVYDRPEKGKVDSEEEKLLNRVASMAIARCKNESTSESAGQDVQHKIHATRMTAGFVQHLRLVAPQKASEIEISEKAVQSCIHLAQLTAYMRAKSEEKAEADETEVELPSRLTEQYIRLAICLAIVLDRKVDSEVLRRVAKVAKDTCHGRSFRLCTLLVSGGKDFKGMSAGLRGQWKDQTLRDTISMLYSLGCITTDIETSPGGVVGRNKHVYRLSPLISMLIKKMNTLLKG